MNKKIIDLNEMRKIVKIEAQDQVAKIQKELQNALNDVFEKDEKMNKELQDFENYETKGEYMFDQFGEIVRWTEFEAPEEYKDYIEELQEYISESYCLHYIEAEGEYSRLESFIGEAIVINDEGDVFQGHECIIDKEEYRDEETGEYSEERRNQLIEEHMEKSGYFPEVFEADYYANLRLINTKE